MSLSRPGPEKVSLDVARKLAGERCRRIPASITCGSRKRRGWRSPRIKRWA